MRLKVYQFGISAGKWSGGVAVVAAKNGPAALQVWSDTKPYYWATGDAVELAGVSASGEPRVLAFHGYAE